MRAHEQLILFKNRDYSINLKSRKFQMAEKIISLLQFFDLLTEDERILVDVLRQIVRESLPLVCKEKLAFNVPYFYGNKGICIIWPASIPGAGIKQGVLLGFWQGFRLNDEEGYLIHGTNKKIFYKIYKTPEEIEVRVVKKLLKEALRVDGLPLTDINPDHHVTD